MANTKGDPKKWKNYKRDFSGIKKVVEENTVKKGDSFTIDELLVNNPLQLDLLRKDEMQAQSVNGTTTFPQTKQGDPVVSTGLQTMLPTSQPDYANQGGEHVFMPGEDLGSMSFNEFLSKPRKRLTQTIDNVSPEAQQMLDDRNKEKAAIDWAVKVGLPVPKIVKDYANQDVHATTKDYANSLIQSFAQTLVVEPLKSIDTWNKNFPIPSAYSLMMGDTPLQERPFYKTGQQLDEGIKEKLPVNPFTEGNFDIGMTRGAGSLAAFYLTSLTGNVIGLSSEIMPMLVGAISQGQSEFDAALERTGDEELAFKIFLANIPVGLSEGLPIGRTLDRINKISGNGISKMLAKGFLEGSFEEGIQEFGQNLASGLIARNTYDDSRDPMDEAITGGLQGFLLGGLANVTGIGVKTGLDKLTGTPKQPQEEQQPTDDVKPSEKIEVKADPESLIVNPIDPKLSQEEKVIELGKLTEKNIPVVDKFIKELDADLGTESKWSIKDPEKILNKANRPSIKAVKEWHDVEHIRDSFRFKTVLDNIDQIRDVYDKINSSGFEIVKVDTDKVLNPKEWGFRILSFDLRMPNGQLVEYYTPLKEIEAAKKDGNHDIFENWREKTEEYIQKHRRSYVRDLNKSNIKYNKAFADYLKRVNQSEDEFSASFTSLADKLGSLTREKLSLRSSGNMTEPLVQAPADLTNVSSSLDENTNTLPVDSSVEANDSVVDFISKDNKIAEENQDKIKALDEYTDFSKFFSRTTKEISTLQDDIATEMDELIQPKIQMIKELKSGLKQLKGKSKEVRETKSAVNKDIEKFQKQVNDIENSVTERYLQFGRDIAESVIDRAKKRKINLPDDEMYFISDDVFEELNNNRENNWNLKIDDIVNVVLDKYAEKYGSGEKFKKPKKPRIKDIVDNSGGQIEIVTIPKDTAEETGSNEADQSIANIRKQQQLDEMNGKVIRFKTNFTSGERIGWILEPVPTVEGKPQVYRVEYYVNGKSKIAMLSADEILGDATREEWSLSKQKTAKSKKPGNTKTKVKLSKLDQEIEDLGNKLINLTKGNLTAGINPEALTISAQLIGKYVEKGYFKFKQMLEDALTRFGEDNFKVLFPSLKMGYNAVLTTADEETTAKMDDFNYVKSFDIEEILKPAIENNNKKPDISGDEKGNDNGTSGNDEDKGQDQSNDPGALETQSSGSADETGETGNAGDNEQSDDGGIENDNGADDQQGDERDNGRTIGSGDSESELAGADTGARNYRITNDAEIVDEKFSLTRKADDNIKAIETLKKIISDYRSAKEVTEDEQKLLVKYVGWGGIPQIFDEKNKQWSSRHNKLKELLTDSEYRSAKASVLNAHYTHPAVIRGIWSGIQKMGLTGGNIVEPAAGIGHFIGLSPKILHDNSSFTAVELDSLTGAIAKYLYPQSDVLTQGFETVPILDESVDLFISNVPFGNYPVTDIDYKEKWKTAQIHNYFFVKAMDKVKAGGIVAFVTSRYTMDSQNADVRNYLNDRAALIGAIRLPSDAFLKNANTEVVTDIIFLRKKFENEKKYNGVRVSDQYYINDRGFKKVNGTSLDEVVPGFEEYDLFYTRNEQGKYKIFEGYTGQGLSSWSRLDDLGKVAKLWSEQMPAMKNKLPELLKAYENQISPRYLKNTDWVSVEKTSLPGKTGEAESRVNGYWLSHPEMILGDMIVGKGLYSDNELTVKSNGDIEAQLNAAIDKLPSGVFQAKKSESTDIYDKVMLENPEVKALQDGEHIILDGVVYRKISEFKRDYGEDAGRTIQSLRKVNLKGTEFEKVKSLIEINSAARNLIEVQNRSGDDKVFKPAMRSLNSLYDSFVKKHGYLNDRKNAKLLTDKEYGEDPNMAFLKALEIYDEDKKKYDKADIFTKRVSFPVKNIEKTDNSIEALTVSLSEFGGVNVERMAELTGKEIDEVVNELNGFIYKDPDSGVYVTKDEYLSGNVKVKLKAAELKSKDDRAMLENIEALRSVIPADLTAADIDISLGSNWIPLADYQEFVDKIVDRKGAVTVEFSKTLNNWRIVYPDRYNYANTSANNSEYGTERVWGSDLVGMALNHRTPKVYDTIGSGSEKQRVLNVPETSVAQEKQQKLKNLFKQWIWEDETRKNRLVSYYNEHFNNLVVREFDGSHITLEGANQEIASRLFPHVKNAAFRITQQRDVLLAHAVGAGKTWSMCLGAMELRRLGIAKKPMISVPNSLVSQFSKEFRMLFPNAKLLTITKEDFKKEKRNIFMSRIATGDWDAVIVSHNTFKMLPVKAETFNQHIYEQLDILQAALSEVRADKNSNRYSIKQIEKAIKKLEEKLRRMESGISRDKTIFFEDLGIDQLFVDEADLYKNLFFATKITNMPGISGSNSERAMDLHIKANYLRKKHGKGITFATGTPVSNSLAELYTMQRYLQPDVLEEYGIAHFDNWVHDFGETETTYEVDVLGTGFQVRTRMGAFMNIPELMNMFRTVADIKTAEDLNLPVPKLKGGKPTDIIIDATEDLQNYIKIELNERMDAVKKREVEPREDNMLKITNDGRKASIDMRLIDQSYEDDPRSKVNVAVGKIFDIWSKTKKKKSTQLVFLDLSTYKKGEFNLYDDIRNKLIKRGIPKKEIAFHQEFETDAAKLRLYDAMNKGEIRVLIGSTERMGAGVNIQKKLIALHHLDPTWRPRDIEQRNGRILRQGNENEEVEIFRYITKGSFETYMWQLLEQKAKFINQIMHGKAGIRRAQDIDGKQLSYSEAKALATGNPLILERFKTSDRLYKLNAMRQDHFRTVEQAKWKLSAYPEQIAQYEKEIAENNTDRSKIPADFKLADHIKDNPLEFDGKKYDKISDFDNAVRDYLKDAANKLPKFEVMHKVGKFLDFEIKVYGEKGWNYADKKQIILLSVWLTGTKNREVIRVTDDFSNSYAQRMLNRMTTKLDLENINNEKQIGLRKQELVKAGELAVQEFPEEQEFKDLEKKLEDIDKELGVGQDQEIDIMDESEQEASNTEYGLRISGFNSLDYQDRKSMMDLVKGKEGQNIGTGEKPDEFIVSDRIKGLLQDIGVLSREKGLLKRLAGKYSKLSKLIRVQALYDIVAAAHETAHFIDDKYSLSDVILNDNDEDLIKALHDVYVDYYPDAKLGSNKKLPVVEGIATFIHEYFQNPAGMNELYPDLVKQFVNPEGKYYKAEFTKLLDGLNDIVEDYAQLTPEERIGARIRDGREVVRRDKGFNVAQRIVYEIQNSNEPLERVAKATGVRYSVNDPSLFAFARSLKNHFMAQWIKGDKMILLDEDGNISEHEGSVSGYLKLVEGKEKQFSRFLIARRVLAEFNELFKLENEYNKLKDKLEEMDPGDLEYLATQREADDVKRNYDQAEQRIKNNDFSLQDAEAVVSEFEDEFSAATAIYDRVNKGLTEFMLKTGLIKKEIADAFNKNDSYAAFYRFVNDEIGTGTMNVSQNSLSKVRSLKKYSGSRLDIIDPVYNQITAITETIGKGLENLTWKKLWDLSQKNWALAQRFENVPTISIINEKSGKLEYPQDKDSTLMRVFVSGERYYFRVAPEFKVIKENFRGEEFNLLVNILTLPSKLFTRLTTSANPIWAMGNLTIDQVTASIQSETGYKFGATAGKSFIDWLRQTEDWKKYKYIGGSRQTFSSSMRDKSPQELKNEITGDTAIGKFIKGVDAGVSVLEMPSNLSELFTRFGEYRRAKDQGKSDLEALYAASEVSVPFWKRGNWFGYAPLIIGSLPYFNATIQALAKFSNTTKEHPVRVGTWYAGALVTAFTTAIATMAAGSDDQRRQLSEMPVRELTRAIYIPEPTGSGFIRIRIPEQIGAVTAMAYLFVIGQYGNNKAEFSDYLKAVTTAIPDQFNVTNPVNMLISWTPKMIRPTFETAANMRTYPDLIPIVPQYLQDKAPEMQYTEYTSNIARFIGRVLKLSPLKVEYWLTNQFGGLGGLIMKSSSNYRPSLPIYRWEKDYVMKGRSYQSFYDSYEAIKQQYSLLKENKDSYGTNEKKDILKQRILFDETNEVLSGLRQVLNEKKELPENIKELSYRLMLGFENGLPNDELVDKLADLTKKTRQLMDDNNLKPGVRLRFSKETFDEKVNTQMEKLGMKPGNMDLNFESKLNRINDVLIEKGIYGYKPSDQEKKSNKVDMDRVKRYLGGGYIELESKTGKKYKKWIDGRLQIVEKSVKSNKLSKQKADEIKRNIRSAWKELQK